MIFERKYLIKSMIFEFNYSSLKLSLRPSSNK